MALIPQALGLEAKDQGVSESAWIVQIAGTIIFQKLIHSWKITIMRSVSCFALSQISFLIALRKELRKESKLFE